MTTTTQRRVAIATIALGITILAYLAVIALSRALGSVMADTGTAPPASGLTPTDIAAWAGALLAATIVTLRIVAPRTKATWDDDLLSRLERLEGAVHGTRATSGEIAGSRTTAP